MLRLTLPALAVALFVSPLFAAESDWIPLLDGKDLSAWQKPSPDWIRTDAVTLDSANPRKLTGIPAEDGKIWLNGTKGRIKDLISKESWGDLDVHVEFLIAKGSNSGVKLHALYEIQILDSVAAKKLSGDSCGGIYPRAELVPKYRHIDEGIAPSKNAARPAGEWQTLDISFQAARFNAEGKKSENARFLKVLLNGELIHDNVELKHPTGHNWVVPDKAKGPLLLQADHGPVAFRNVKVRVR